MSVLLKACVIGHPIAHSLSPRLHQYWLKKYGINGEYQAYDIPPEQLESFIRAMPGKGFAGGNVTVPHKEAVMALLDEMDDLARSVGAVNTIIVRNGRLLGSNTDVEGFVRNIAPHLRGKNKAVVLGAGGAAKAVIVGLQQLGFSSITITNRTRAKAEGLARHHALSVEDWQHKEAALKQADLLVNTTSLGLAGKEPLMLSLEHLPETALVTDIVYHPLITPLLAQARERGNPIVDGLGMLLYQAAPGFEQWFGVKPEVTQELRDIMIRP